jgi:glyoxylase-like metal-dependent hydrolase (beta-lactamase superfamily II)
MKSLKGVRHAPAYVLFGVAAASLVVIAGMRWTAVAVAERNGVRPGTSSVRYANMPAIAPIGVRADKYLEVPAFAKGPAIDRAKGYRTQKLGDALYMITDGAYQSMFMTYEDGVVVVDAPPSYALQIPKAIAEVTAKPITHLVYSHAHIDHIGGAKSLGGQPVIVAHSETNRLLTRDSDRSQSSPGGRDL